MAKTFTNIAATTAAWRSAFFAPLRAYLHAHTRPRARLAFCGRGINPAHAPAHAGPNSRLPGTSHGVADEVLLPSARSAARAIQPPWIAIRRTDSSIAVGAWQPLTPRRLPPIGRRRSPSANRANAASAVRQRARRAAIPSTGCGESSAATEMAPSSPTVTLPNPTVDPLVLHKPGRKPARRALAPTNEHGHISTKVGAGCQLAHYAEL
jgi:hypothetical protein